MVQSIIKLFKYIKKENASDKMTYSGFNSTNTSVVAPELTPT